MLQITVDVAQLNQSQREAIAGFILSFPAATTSDVNQEVDDNVILPTITFAPEDDAEPSPEAVFGQPAAQTEPASNLDKDGLPWDERIHSSSKARTADGRWRKKRGLDEGQATQVEAQLKALMAVPAPPPVATADPAPPPAPAAPTPVGDRQGFINLITQASNAIQAQKITQEDLNALVVAAGVPSLPLLGNRLDLVPQVQASLDTLLSIAA